VAHMGRPRDGDVEWLVPRGRLELPTARFSVVSSTN